MSCGSNHKFDTYQSAADSAKLAVIEALNTDEETDTLEELWGIYLKLRSIADNSAQHSAPSLFGDDTIVIGSGSTAAYNIEVDTSNFEVGLSSDFTLAAEPVTISTVGQDVINFGESASADTITFG
tara:strand:+ start:137 stop:514 length:378 start_codon:yes stop_codon:yes gene_type:complete